MPTRPTPPPKRQALMNINVRDPEVNIISERFHSLLAILVPASAAFNHKKNSLRSFQPTTSPFASVPAERQAMKKESHIEPIRIPLGYLLSSSSELLHEFELTRLAHVSNLQKEMSQIERELYREQAAADVARFLIENRDEILRQSGEWLLRVEEKRLGDGAKQT
jgi:hypothetical protein